MLSVTIEYDDGRTEQVQNDFADLQEACHFALNLADRHGQDQGDGHGPPRWVHILHHAKKEISISVVRGGLLSGLAG